MGTHEPLLEALLKASAGADGIDRKALAGLFLQAACAIDRERGAQAAGVTALDPRLHELRRVLVGGEIDQLAELSEQVQDPEAFAKLVGHALPAALAQASARDDRLGQVLAPTLERAAQTSIRNDLGNLVNILHPVMLPAIRKSIGEAIEGTFQSLNESLKHSLTWRGLKWRFEAWRSGQSFAEVVLKHTLVYQVEHAFLIHRHTGLLIAHATAEHAASQDPQIVSSMLVAIQDFVKDSFSGAGSTGVDALRLGELLLWSEQVPEVTLVAVIRGNPPEALRDTLRAALANIHTEHAAALAGFDGDSSAFADVQARLAGLVNLRQEADRRQRAGFPWLLVPIVLALLVGIGWLWSQWRADANRWEAFVQRLKSEPGIVVTGAERRDGKWMLAGLRDPLAADPVALLAESKIPADQVVFAWQPYQALNLPLVLKRVQAMLDPPPTLRLAIEGDLIVATGEASQGWLRRAQAQVGAMPLGSPAVELGAVRDINDGALGRLTATINGHWIRFDPGEALPAAGQEAAFDRIVADIRALVELSAAVRVNSRVILTGHADSTGKGTSNLSLSVARAEAVRSFLKQRGIDPRLMAVRGAGQLEPLKEEATETDRSLNRRVSLTVAIDE